METTRALMPRARQDELVVEELQDETLVYDLERHKACCLSRTVKSRVVCKSERKLLDASVRLPWRPPSVREA